MTDYGVFGNLVTTAGCLAASGAAITLSWMKRAQWQPPEEALPKVVARFAGLVAMILIAWIFVFGASIGLPLLAMMSGILLTVALAALYITIRPTLPTHFIIQIEPKKIGCLGEMFSLWKQAK